MAKKKLPFIPVQMPDMDAAFAGKQYIIDAAHNRDCKHSKLYPLFRETILRLLYANFEWTGDITPIEAAAVERKLIETGRVVAVSSSFDPLAMTPGGVYYGTFGVPTSAGNASVYGDPDVELTYDFYGQPSAASCVGLNGVIFNSPSDRFVIGYDTMCINLTSPMVTPLMSYIDTLAENIDNAYSAWRVSVETNKLGMVFNTPDETSSRVLQKVLEKISANAPFVITRGNMSERVDATYRPGGQSAIGAFYQNYLNAWSLVLDMLGVENESAQKRERMVVEEAVRNNSLSKAIGYDRLHARQLFAEQVREKLGKNIEVKNAYTALLDEDDANGNGQLDVGEGQTYDA